MKKIAQFIIKYRILIFSIMVVFAIICGSVIGKVNQNKDMTKYLSDSSNMKQGMDLMKKEFPKQESFQEIRVMFEGLKDDKKEEIVGELEKIQYVHSVTYDKKSKSYNKGKYTLYKISTDYEYGSVQMEKIHKDVEEQYKDYKVSIIDNGSKATLGMDIIVTAVILMLIILFVMSKSWIEPVLCVFAIGIAILINMGTNIFMESVSATTFSIAAILQLALSMDYSIILINRYRQEKENINDNKEAMTVALTNAFSSITSSAFTTFVGLLMLVFMDYKLGLDMGVVLAKGVFCSWLVILTVFPFLILLFDKVLVKTAKKSPHVNMEKIAFFSYKYKKVMPVLFVILFIVAFILQQKTGYRFSSIGEDSISKIIPRNNVVVTLYDNKDEDKIAKIVSKLEKEEKVDNIISYPTTIGKQVDVEEMQDMIGDYTAGSDMSIDESLLSILYYDYHTNGKLPSIAISELIEFIADDVIKNESFSKELDKDMVKQIKDMKKYADKKTLTKKMSINELAKFFDIDKKDLKSLFILYYSEKGGVDTGSMTLKTFVNFISNDVMNNKDYKNMFDNETKKQIKTLKMYVDKEEMTKKMSYKEAANLLGIDKEKVKLLYVYYYANKKDYSPSKMTINDFIDFILNKVAKDEMFSSKFDKKTLAQIESLKKFTDKKTIKSKLSSKKMASFLEMDKPILDLVYSFYHGTNKNGVESKITLVEFIDFILNKVMNNAMLASNFDGNMVNSLNQMSGLLNVAVSGKVLAPVELASILGMEESQVTMLMSMAGTESMTLTEFTNFMVNVVLANETYSQMIDATTQESLKLMNNLMQVAVSGVELNVSEMAQIVGVEKEQVALLYIYYTGTKVDNKKMTPMELVNYLLEAKETGGVIGSAITDDIATQLKIVQNFMNITVDNTKFSYSKLAKMLGMDSKDMKLLYTLHDSYKNINKWKLSMQTIVDFLVDNSKLLGDMINSSTKDSLKLAQKIINGTVKETKYSVAEMANLLDMDKKQLNQLYLLYITEYGDTSSWGTSIKKLVDFLVKTVLNNEKYADMFDKKMADTLEGAKVIIDAVISGKKYTAKKASKMLKGITDEIDGNTVELLYLYYGSQKNINSKWTMSIETLFYHLADEMIYDKKFNAFIDKNMKKQIKDSKTDLQEGIDQLVGDNYSIMMINTTYPDESSETYNFVDTVNKTYNKNVSGKYYMIGNSVMNYEMQNSFHREVLLMTIFTALSIFIIVACTFKSVSIPAILVLIVQCAVYVTVAYSGLTQGPMQYIAYLLVQCILMGATIDYAILFTNYYKENRRLDVSIKEALKEAYQGSIHTIFTSGAVLLTVTGIIGMFSSDVTGDSCKQVAIGTFVAILMILFVLPGTIAVFDKMLLRRERKRQLKMQYKQRHI